MSDEIRNTRKIIEIAAMLQSAAKQDERLVELASMATSMVLKDADAVNSLFEAFLNPPPEPPQARNNILEHMRAKQQPTQQDTNDAMALLKAIVEKTK